MVIEILQKEIPTREVGYIILRDCPEDRLAEGLNKGMERLKKAGAKTVLATSLPEGDPLNDGPVGVWRLTHVYDLIRMERPMESRVKPEKKLVLKPLKRAADDKLYAELANRAFANVVGAKTVSPSEPRIPNCRRGLAYWEDKPVGAYEVDLNEKTPELTRLCVEPELWRQGLGRTLLRTLMDSLPKTEKMGLTLSSRNEPAIALFTAEGFVQTGVVSSWFQVV